MKLYAYDGAWQIDHLLIVGVGGTGSSLAHITARILWQSGQMGQSVPLLHLVDPDVVEEKNVGRQGYKLRGIYLRYLSYLRRYGEGTICITLNGSGFP
ncbi:MAG: hypothetical protein F9K27_15965 [Anaerolineae bacterium]|nr:MAG: hypothetical protein F9K27_15965 [Anaerolineae bacterium]